MKTYTGIIKLACLVVAAPLFIWVVSLKDTVHLYKEMRKLEKTNQSLSVSPSKDQMRQDLLPSSPLLSNGKILQVFADSLSHLDIDVITYTPELIEAEQESKLYAGKLVLAGGYMDLVRMISIIEGAGQPIKLASLRFDYDRKKRNPSYAISMTALLVQIEH